MYENIAFFQNISALKKTFYPQSFLKELQWVCLSLLLNITINCTQGCWPSS